MLATFTHAMSRTNADRAQQEQQRPADGALRCSSIVVTQAPWARLVSGYCCCSIWPMRSMSLRACGSDTPLFNRAYT